MVQAIESDRLNLRLGKELTDAARMRTSNLMIGRQALGSRQRAFSPLAVSMLVDVLTVTMAMVTMTVAVRVRMRLIMRRVVTVSVMPAARHQVPAIAGKHDGSVERDRSVNRSAMVDKLHGTRR